MRSPFVDRKGLAEGLLASASQHAMRNLRGLCILFLLAMHSVMPYLSFLKPSATAFDQPPYDWLSFPIVDARQCFGFEIFDGWQDVYLMGIMFFMAGLFTGPSLISKGERVFLAGRVKRLGPAFLLGVLIVTPIALYPAYVLTTTDPTLSGYLQTYASLPFLPNAALWFLWMLMLWTVALVALRRLAPKSTAYLVHWASAAGARPFRFFLGLATAAALAYVPLAVAFTPLAWTEQGPISFQLARPLLYLVYFVAGFAVGADGLENGLLAPQGALARGWRSWLLGALASLVTWMGLTGWTMSYPAGAPLPLQIVADASYAVAGTSSVFFLLAASVRFAELRSSAWNRLADESFGIYVLHYAPMVWLQYALLNVPLPGFFKAIVVFVGALLVAFTLSASFQRLRGEWRERRTRRARAKRAHEWA